VPSPHPVTDVGTACFHAGMGRHEAADGAATHPLVADALSRRPVNGGRGEHEEPPLPGREGPIGWPGSGPDEGGEPIGWPDGRADDRPEDELPSGTAGKLRGWRRLLRPPAA
jgi:hypothetical protein